MLASVGIWPNPSGFALAVMLAACGRPATGINALSRRKWLMSLKTLGLTLAGVLALAVLAVGLSYLREHRWTEAALATLTSAVILHFMGHSVKEG